MKISMPRGYLIISKFPVDTFFCNVTEYNVVLAIGDFVENSRD